MSNHRIQTLDGGETELPRSVIEAFRAGLHGSLILQGDPSHDGARKVWNGMIDRRPALIVRCVDPGDAVACVRFAGDYGLRLSVRGGGHNVAGNAVCDGGLVIDLSEMQNVLVDAPKAAVHIQGGATLGCVDRSTASQRMATPTGVVSATGYSGLALHGGTGWQLRRHGLAADNILAADIVTADGRLLRADREENPELLWALQGGGGNFGVVTSFTSRLNPIPDEVFSAVPIFPLAQAGRVLRFFRDYIAAASEELMCIAALWTCPDEDGIPEAQRGRPALFLIACYVGDAEAGARAVEPLTRCATPIADLGGGRMPWVEAQRMLDDDYPDGRRYYWKSTLIKDLSDAVIDTVIDHTVSRPSQLTSIDIWPLGGAFSRVAPDATAFGSRDVSFMVNYESNWEAPERDRENVTWTRQCLERVKELSQSRTYLNFPGQAEEGERMVKDALGANYARLQRIKHDYDPRNLFRGHLNIPPAYSRSSSG